MATKKQKYSRFKNAILAVDTAVFGIVEGKLNVLVIQINKKELKGQWALPGGLIEVDEDLEQAAHRILAEKAGIKKVLLDQLATFGKPNRDPFGRVVSVAYLALVDARKYELTTTEHYDDIKWVPVNKLPKMAYDHKEMTKVAVERLKGKLEYTNIAQGILPTEFTLTELKELYELILNKKIDKRNFRRKILALDMLVETKKKTKGQKSRPATLFKFKSKKLQIFNIL